jgi:hypothetical protein
MSAVQAMDRSMDGAEFAQFLILLHFFSAILEVV